MSNDNNRRERTRTKDRVIKWVAIILSTIIAPLGGWTMLTASENSKDIVAISTTQENTRETLVALNETLKGLKLTSQDTYDLVKAIDTRQKLTDQRLDGLNDDMNGQGVVIEKVKDRLRAVEVKVK